MDAQIMTGAALDVLDEVGLDKLSMRLVAARLGVQVGGLYYYVTDKAALLRAMADEFCEQVQGEFGSRGGTTALELCRSLRTVLNRHRDSARVLAASPLNGSLNALALMERLIEILEPDIGDGLANLAADTLMAYVTGFVLQEQSGVPLRFPLTLAELAVRFPRVFRAVDDDDDEKFDLAVHTIIAGFRRPTPESRPASPGS